MPQHPEVHRTHDHIDQRRDKLYRVDILRRIRNNLPQAYGLLVSFLVRSPLHFLLIQRTERSSEAVKKHINKNKYYEKNNTGSRPTVVHLLINSSEFFLYRNTVLSLNIPFSVKFVKNPLLCIQFQTNHQGMVDLSHNVTVEMTHLILQTLLVYGSQLLQKHNGILIHIIQGSI